MNRKPILVAVLSLVMVAAGYGLVHAHDSGYGNNNDSGSGQGMMGQGGGMMGNMMGQGGGMMGQGGGMMGQGGGMMGQGRRGSISPRQTPLTEEDARILVEYQLRFVVPNPNLKVGKVKKTEDGFEVQVVTRKGEVLVDRFLVEGDTGRIYRILE